MPGAYHSALSKNEIESACKFAILPFKMEKECPWKATDEGAWQSLSHTSRIPAPSCCPGAVEPRECSAEEVIGKATLTHGLGACRSRGYSR
jgi:hypothetical protein|eukprot:COSAG01_NODE_1030_length_12019_cov_94.008725_4_plen_91_part_00